MSELTTGSISHKRVTGEHANKFAKQSANILIAGNSPFIHDAVIELKDAYFVQTAFDGKIAEDAPTKLAFETSVGLIVFPMLIRVKYDADNKEIVPNGTFNKFVKDNIGSRTVEDFAKYVVSKVAKLRVKRKGYRKDGPFGPYQAAMVEFDIEEYRPEPAQQD